jgi:hypothetical protein
MNCSGACRSFWLFAFFSAFPVVGFSQPATQPSGDDTASQVQELRSEVQDLRARLDAQSPAATQPADAGLEQNNLQQNNQAPQNHPGRPILPGFAGWDPNKGFVIRSADGAFLLHPWVFVQVRDATNYRSQESALGGSDTENGFELPRAKFIFDGNVFTKDLTYQFIWATSDTSGNLGLQDAWGRYHIPTTPFAIEAGQIRDPVDHEQILFATKSMTPERSIVNNVLLNGDGIVKGVELSCGYDEDSILRGEWAFTSGEQNFDSSFVEYPTNNANWGTAGRIELKMMGNWNDYTQFTALADQEPLLVFGGGFDYTEAGAAAPLLHVADVQYDLPEGTSVYAAYLGRYTRDNAGPPTTDGQFTATSTSRHDTYDATVRLMVAQLIDQRFEPFFRYEYIQFDPREITSGLNSTVNDLTLGCNYYFYGHRLKFTAAASYLPNGSPVSSTIGDLLTSHRGNEVIVQVQFQLMV